MKKTYLAPETEELGLVPNMCVCDARNAKARSSKKDDDDDSGSLLW